MKDRILHMRVSAEDLIDLDNLRRREKDVPPRAEMVRRLIQRAAAPGSKRQPSRTPTE